MSAEAGSTSLRRRSGLDQEKQTLPPHAEHRQHEGPSQKTALPRWRNRGKEKSSIALVCTWVVDHQISIALYLLSALFFVHILFSHTRHHTSKFFQISYYNPRTGTYALGWDDIFFVFYWIIVFTGARCATMDYVLTPLARWCGISKKKTQIRFAEQSWITLYYTLFWGTGMYIMYKSDYWLSLRALWRDWPTREMDGLAKWYYLVQFAFWLQQIVVVNIEERRKDHWQMLTHHIITCALIFSSYGYHQTKVGNLFLCIMDFVDIVFAVAKILKYLQYQTACDIAFGVFMISYFITRQALYMTVCYSAYKYIPEDIRYGCYRGSVTDIQGPFPIPNDWDHLTQPFRDPIGLVCWNDNIKWAFLAMLLALQCVLLGWFGMILRVAYMVLTGQGAGDTRSDDEDEEVKEADKDLTMTNYIEKPQTGIEPKPFVERETLSTDQDFDIRHAKIDRKPTPSPVRRSSRKRGDGHSSSVNLLAASDRRELLGRIGCDKPSSDS